MHEIWKHRGRPGWLQPWLLWEAAFPASRDGSVWSIQSTEATCGPKLIHIPKIHQSFQLWSEPSGSGFAHCWLLVLLCGRCWANLTTSEMTEIQSGTKSSIQKPGDILKGFLFWFGLFFCEMQPAAKKQRRNSFKTAGNTCKIRVSWRNTFLQWNDL